MKLTPDDSVDKLVKCPCGKNISFGPMGENLIVGIQDYLIDEYLQIAPIVNWAGTHLEKLFREIWKNKEGNKVLFDKMTKLENEFYNCKCGRLFWRQAGQDKVLVFKSEVG